MTELSVDDQGQQGNVDDVPLSGSYSIHGITILATLLYGVWLLCVILAKSIEVW